MILRTNPTRGRSDCGQSELIRCPGIFEMGCATSLFTLSPQDPQAHKIFSASLIEPPLDKLALSNFLS